MAAVDIREVAAERGHFHLRAVFVHQDHAEGGAHLVSARINFRNLFGPGVGGDIVIGRLAAKQQITHATAHQVGLEATQL